MIISCTSFISCPWIRCLGGFSLGGLSWISRVIRAGGWGRWTAPICRSIATIPGSTPYDRGVEFTHSSRFRGGIGKSTIAGAPRYRENLGMRCPVDYLHEVLPVCAPEPSVKMSGGNCVSKRSHKPFRSQFSGQTRARRMAAVWMDHIQRITLYVLSRFYVGA